MKLEKLLEELDPVGKDEDGEKVGVGQIRDIDNDGDIDSSDEYLAYRRKKVSQAMNEGFESDESVARELKLFIDNDAELYRQRTMPIMKNLARKIRKGSYDSELAVKLWKYLADAGAKKYAREHGSPGVSWHDMFPVSVRMMVAKELAEDFDAEMDVGGLTVDDLLQREHRTINVSKKQITEMVRKAVRKQLNEGAHDSEWEMLDKIRGVLGDTKTLEELVQGLPTSVAVDHLEYVARMHDIDLGDDDGHVGLELDDDEDLDW